MTHSMTIELPEAVYQSLSEEAEAKGRKVEEILVERLVRDAPVQIDDPFEKFIGSFDSKGMDWARRHDEYLGENLMRELRGENE